MQVIIHSIIAQTFTVGAREAQFLVQDFAVIMIVAAVMLLITHKLKQPMVIGYIIAGMIIGPYTPPFSMIHDLGLLNNLAELGIIILMFVIGTEFPIAKLKSVGKTSLVIALTESLATLTIVFFVSQTIGFSYFDSLFLALAMSITSTIVTMKVLEELGIIKEKSSVVILGMLIVEDVLAVTALGVLQSIAVEEISAIELVISLGIVAGFIGGILILGSRFLPHMIDKVARTNDYSVLLIVILGLAFGLSFAASELGLSVVIGAFLAGVLVAESASAPIARVVTVPLRDVFAAIFFVSVGALMDISKIPIYIIPAIILILTSFATKFLITAFMLSKIGHNGTTAIRTGLGISAARGELSLVIGKAGQDLGVISSFILPILGVVTIVTTFVTPYILKMGTRLNISASDTEAKSR
jgi:K+:H+ antiporter